MKYFGARHLAHSPSEKSRLEMLLGVKAGGKG